jgi:hypothetical protein
VCGCVWTATKTGVLVKKRVDYFAGFLFSFFLIVFCFFCLFHFFPPLAPSSSECT